MKYAMVNNLLEFYDNGDGTYTVRNYILDEEFELDADLVEVLKKLDGKHSIRKCAHCTAQEAEELEKLLLENDLIRDSRFTVKGLGLTLFALWIASPKENKGLHTAARIYYRLINILWLPVLAAGFYALTNDYLMFDDVGLLAEVLSLLGGMAVGIVLHELAHAAAAINYGVSVYEIGAGLQFVIPFGYTLLGDREKLPRTVKAKIYLAGMQADAMIAGLALMLSAVSYRFGGVMLFVGILNCVMIVFNILPYMGSDGYIVLCALLGLPEGWSCREKIKEMNKRSRYRGRKGLNRTLHSIANGFLILFGIEGALVILMDVISVIMCFN